MPSLLFPIGRAPAVCARAAGGGAAGPVGRGASRLWDFCGDLGLRGCFQHHDKPALPGDFAGEASCSAITEAGGPENDRPAEKRKVGGSTPPLTTTTDRHG